MTRQSRDRRRQTVEEIDAELEKLLTERRNPASMEIDRKSTEQILRIINDEDKKIPFVVEKQIPRIAEVVDIVAEKLRKGGRLIYVGAGTSGRLGVVDAAECPPTFSTPPEMVQGIIAGGRKAVWRSVEGAEDDADAGREAVAKRRVNSKDIVIGLSASGRAPFVAEALREARRRGAATAAIATTAGSRIAQVAERTITLAVGPEVVTGSTRMKAGTAEKLVLNMISTASMTKIGKVYSNLMIDLQPWSEKLRSRARRILRVLTGIDSRRAQEVFEAAGRDLKTALVMTEADTDPRTAGRALRKSRGMVWEAIETVKKERR